MRAVADQERQVDEAEANDDDRNDARGEVVGHRNVP
jgi:hypothetical protein